MVSRLSQSEYNTTWLHQYYHRLITVSSGEVLFFLGSLEYHVVVSRFRVTTILHGDTTITLVA